MRAHTADCLRNRARPDRNTKLVVCVSDAKLLRMRYSSKLDSACADWLVSAPFGAAAHRCEVPCHAESISEVIDPCGPQIDEIST
jgi:hypothetical protein